MRTGFFSVLLLVVVHSLGEAADDSAFVARQRRLLEVLSKEPLSLPSIWPEGSRWSLDRAGRSWPRSTRWGGTGSWPGRSTAMR